MNELLHKIKELLVPINSKEYSIALNPRFDRDADFPSILELTNKIKDSDNGNYLHDQHRIENAIIDLSTY